MIETIIPYKVSLLLPTVESWGKIGKDDKVVTLISDAKKWNNSKNNDCFWSEFKDKKDIKFEKITVMNKGFTIEFLEEYGGSTNNHHVIKYYTPASVVKIKHPDFERYPFEIHTVVPDDILVSLIGKVGYVSDRKLSGNFCVGTLSGMSGIWITSFLVEDPEDSKLMEGIESGKKMSEEKFTKKWVPGYKYLLKNGDPIIYLGKMEDFIGFQKSSIYSYSSRYRNGNPLEIGFDSYNKIVREKGVQHLFLDVKRLNKPSEGFLNSVKGYDVVTFILSYLNFCRANGHQNEIRMYLDDLKPGVKCEEVFKSDGKNLKDIISGYYTGIFKAGMKYPSVDEVLVYINKDNLKTDEDKAHYDYKVKKYVEEYLKRYRGIKKEENIIFSLKTDSFSYYNRSAMNLYTFLGDDEFKKILKTCLP
jgi:hypothetical protein